MGKNKRLFMPASNVSGAGETTNEGTPSKYNSKVVSSTKSQ